MQVVPQRESLFNLPLKCGRCGYIGDAFHRSRPDTCRKCLAEAQRAYRRKRPKGYWKNKDRKYALKKRYGITLEQYEEMIQEQGGRCAICGLNPADCPGSARVMLHVDHDHKTGAVRRLLCNGCNRAIGLINEKPETAERIAAYLREFQDAQPR